MGCSEIQEMFCLQVIKQAVAQNQVIISLIRGSKTMKDSVLYLLCVT